MRMFHLLIVAATLPAFMGIANAAEPASAWSLLPQPAEMHPAAHGAVTVSDGDRVLVQAEGDAQALAVAQRFAALIATTRGLHLRVETAADKSSPAAIVFRLDSRADVPNDAGYRIAIGDGKIGVTARTTRGLFYGGVTVWQLLTSDATRDTPAHVVDGSIVDHPRFAWRGLMLDSARHFQSAADIKKLIDWMSLNKLNVLHWHLSDDQGWRIRIPNYPELTKIGACRKAVGPDAALTGGPDKPYCGFYTDAEVRDVVHYAAERFIEVVPEIDIPGHSQAAIASYPWLGVSGKRPDVSTDWGINTWLLKPDARSLKFVDDVMDHVMALFPSKYIHIGGDEAAKDQWEASPEVRAHMKKLGLANMEQLQGWFTTQVANYLQQHGRTAVGWDEILHGKVPASAVVMSWNAPSGAVEALQQGHDVVMSSSPTLYLDHYQSDLHDEPPGRPDVESLKDVYDYNPVPDGVTVAESKHILGVQANLWAEYMPTFARAQHAVFPRIAALSEIAWSPASAHDWAGFLRRMPAELARYRALGIEYADSAFAPAFKLSRGTKGTIEVVLSNQADFGTIRYTTDGAAPDVASPSYSKPLTFPADSTTTVRAATFASDGFELAAPRTQVVDAAALLTRNSDQLDTCGKPLIVLRLEDDRPLDGPRPVYRLDIANMCWQWKHAPLDGVKRIALTVGNLPWNFALWKDDSDVVTRSTQTSAGELQVHRDACDGPLLATLPLAKAARTKLQTTLTAGIPATAGNHTLCVFATGDPRDGMWAIDKIELQKTR
ncbi:MAG TPA: family 20 glycosylhydrolase [Rhodanobacteraceae bacterium]|nr:family 20 glycosylhydrolase [Rhodanobacteraceae bacterium]